MVATGMMPELIGHRGEPESFPENSIAGYATVLQAGATFIETDVQITADGVPILSHDPSLQKITGHNLAITGTRYADIASLPAAYPERFADRFNDLHICRLNDFADLLGQWPQARAFVEIKHASIKVHGINRVIDIMLDTLQDCLSQCILISFEYEALQQVRRQSRLPIGWVLPEWSGQMHAQATALQPEYLFCNRKRLPADLNCLWDGPWRWVIYTINSIEDALTYAALGADMVETNTIRQLMAATGHDHD